MQTAEKYMRRALALAEKGEGHVSPNPLVGCVVVKDGRIIGEGYHEKFGGYHAERNALLHCTEDPAGADLYVTLEPCCHQGKTPPCTDIILEKKIRRVFAGTPDVNPKVAGKGFRILKEAGLEVTAGVLEEECRKQNEIFFHYMSTGRPFVAAKYAMSLDGKIACRTGDSKWITGPEAREDVHRLRRRYSAILAGIGTVLSDDPMLNCRIEEGVDPLRIVCDSSLRLPEDSRIVKSARQIPTLLACSEEAIRDGALSEKRERLAKAGLEIRPFGEEKVDLDRLLSYLGSRQIDSVLVEGGHRIHGAVLDGRLADKLIVYLGNTVLGGEGAPSPVSGLGSERMADCPRLENIEIRRLGEDLRLTADFIKDAKEVGASCSPGS